MRFGRATSSSGFGFVLVFAMVWISATGILGAQAAPPSAPIEIVVQHDVPMKTRDGVVLYADVYRPKSPDKFPVILMRTPYDKSVTWAV